MWEFVVALTYDVVLFLFFFLFLTLSFYLCPFLDYVAKKFFYQNYFKSSLEKDASFFFFFNCFLKLSLFRVTLQSGGAWLIRLQRRTQQMTSHSHGRGRKLCVCIAHPKASASPFDTSLCTRRSQRCTTFR